MNDEQGGPRASSFPPALGDILAKVEAATEQKQPTPATVKEADEDEEL